MLGFTQSPQVLFSIALGQWGSLSLALNSVLRNNGCQRFAFEMSESRRKERAVISASFEEVASVLSGWSESKARIRFIAEWKNGIIEFECTVHSVVDDAIVLLVSGQSRGLATVNLAGCEFFFGDDDVPSNDRTIGLRFGVGISLITAESDSVWLLEMVDEATEG